MNAEDRFSRFADKSGPCWLWTGALTGDGYPQFSFGGTNVYAHRFAYTVANGSIPDGMSVCHKCDNPKCVNPDHLFAGTRNDNNQDMFKKKRHVFGEKCRWSKLSLEQVSAIRSSTKTQRAISEEFGISQANVSMIRSGKRWKDAQTQAL